MDDVEELIRDDFVASFQVVDKNWKPRYDIPGPQQVQVSLRYDGLIIVNAPTSDEAVEIVLNATRQELVGLLTERSRGVGSLPRGKG